MPKLLVIVGIARKVKVLMVAALCSAMALGAQPLQGQDIGPDDDPRTESLDSIFAEWAGEDRPGCIVGVGKEGRPLVARGYGMANLEHQVPMSPDVVSEIGSVSKQFTAAALLLLAEDGALSLEDPVQNYVPELGISDPLTLRQLAGHTSGIRDWIGLVELAGRPWGEVIHTVPEILDVVVNQSTLNFAPGERYLYSNSGYLLMLEVIQRVSGMSFVDFTQQRLFRPLGMEDTQWRFDHAKIVPNRAIAHRPSDDGGYRTQMPFSDAIGSGGLLTTVGDMLTWTDALHSGEVGGPKFLSEMTRLGVLTDGSNTDYGLGLRIGDFRGIEEISHGGSTAGYRAFLAYYPTDELAVALQCNVTAVSSGDLGRSVARVFLGEGLLTSTGGDERVEEPDAVGEPRPDHHDRRADRGLPPQAFSGHYRSHELGVTYRITETDPGLTVHRGIVPEWELSRTSEYEFEVEGGGDGTLKFLRDEDGTIEGFEYTSGRILDLWFSRTESGMSMPPQN